MSLIDELQQVKDEATEAFARVTDLEALEQIRAKHLGKSSPVKTLLGRMGEVPKEERPQVGKIANQISNTIKATFEKTKARLEQEAAEKPQLTGEALLRQERIEKLEAYNQALGKDAAWGGRVTGLTPIAAARGYFPQAYDQAQPDSEQEFGRVVMTALLFFAAVPMFLVGYCQNFWHFLIAGLGFGQLGQGARGDVGVDEQGFDCVAGGRVLGFCIDNDGGCQC